MPNLFSQLFNLGTTPASITPGASCPVPIAPGASCPVPPLSLPPDPNCGKCSGVRQYNSQIPENNTCDFSQSQPYGPPSSSIFNQPGYTGPPPVSPTSWGSKLGKTVPPQVGQFNPNYFQPTTQLPPSYPQPGDNPGGNRFSRPCPRVDNKPTPVYPKQPNPIIQQKQPSGPDNNPCPPCGPNPVNGYTWNNRGSQRQPLVVMCGSGNMPCPTNPFPPLIMQPGYIPPILQSGKRRSSTTPDDLCYPQ